MEGPSLVLAAEQLKPFINKTVLEALGNTKIGKERFLGKTTKDIFSWGKHLIIQFEDFALRTHFLLWGTFEAEVLGKSVTGDYPKKGNPRLLLKFKNGRVTIYNSSLKILETKYAKGEYDFSVDTMSESFDKEKALQKILQSPDEFIADVLLDQEIFAGVGNIIKNEVLFIKRINPHARVSKIPKVEIENLIEETVKFCFKFYDWRRVFMLKKNLKIYRKSVCPVCNSKIKVEIMGKRMRKTFYCPICQPAKS